MKQWAVDLAKEFKNRDNKEFIGAIVGDVLSVNPLKIGIEDNQIILDHSHFWLCGSLKEYAKNATITATGNINTDATITYKNILSLNDKVLVIASEDNQTFFIVDKLF